MTEPTQDETEAQLHPGPHEEGGTGGMATRELKAHEADEQGDDSGDVEED